MNSIDHITVCICTYKRTEQLERLLCELEKQITRGAFTYSIVIVDNDRELSAEKTVAAMKSRSGLDIEYYHEPVQNIALARNLAVKKSTGKFLAFIDDDEFPVQDWLMQLHALVDNYDADGVLGPVKPHFEIPPPEWLVRGKLLVRSSFPTGTVLRDPRHTRTGNVLFRKSLFMGEEQPFDPRFGRTGGEDTDFFTRMLARGKVFVWCEEACAYETVTAERLNKTYFLKRALLRGTVAAHKNPCNIILALKSLAAFIIYTTVLPVLYVMGQHLFMKILVKDCDHIGRILGILNISPIKERNF